MRDILPAAMLPSGTNSLYLLRLKARQAVRGMPNPDFSAWVDCFVAAPDLETAGSNVVHKLCPKGFLIEECEPIQQIDPKSWATLIRGRYALASAPLPSEADIARLIETGGVLLGPFSDWEEP